MRSMILGLLLLTANVAQAETVDKGTYTLGRGSSSCGPFIAAVGNAPLANGMYVSWLAGFVSGYNATAYIQQQPQVIGFEVVDMDLWVRNWCNKHPTEKVIVAALAFIIEMRNNAGQR